MNDNNILAVVLAGGKSKRFGQDKNCVKLGSRTLLEHVLFKINNKFEEKPWKWGLTKKCCKICYDHKFKTNTFNVNTNVHLS